MKKTLIAVLLSCVLLAGLSFSSAAEVSHTPVFCTSGTAGQWTEQPAHNLTYSSSYDHLCGGDVGLWFYYTTVGLQASFVQSTSRVVDLEQFEKDSSGSTKTRHYQGHFDNNNIGSYQPTYFTLTYTNSGTIEDDGTVELYFKYKVGKIYGDTSTAVPSGIMKYAHWTY